MIIIRKWKKKQISNVHFLENAIELINKNNQFDVKSESDLYNKMKLEFTLMKNNLQLAASSSQFKFHGKALNRGFLCLKHLSSLIDNIGRD